MAALTNYLENRIIDWLLRGQSFSPPATTYAALFTSAPSDAGGGTEVSGGSYARVAITSSATNWRSTQGDTSTSSTGTSGTTVNNVDITFPAPTANWGTVTHFALFDASTSGNMLIWGALTTPKTINNGDAAPKFTAGDLSFQIDN